MVRQIEILLEIKDEADDKKNLLHLLTRLEPFSDMEVNGKVENYSHIVILQLSGFGEIQRIFLSELFAELFWQEIKNGNRRFEIIIFDEFHSISIKTGSALASMLREGRKFNLSVWMSTQFIENYDAEQADTLMQAGHILFFRPTPKDTKTVANLIDSEHTAEWKKVLGNLRIGEAVILGEYVLQKSGKRIEHPIIGRIDEQ